MLMRTLRRAGSLSPSDALLLARAGFAVAGVHLALKALPWPSLIAWLDAVKRRHRLHQDPGRLAWAVSHASRVVPGAVCLTQALALHYLLLRAGHPSTVQIGVAKERGTPFRAHAWVESRGRLLLGGDVGEFTRLLQLGPLNCRETQRIECPQE